MPVERTFKGEPAHDPRGMGNRRDRHSSDLAEHIPEIEIQESPRRIGDGKGLNLHEFDDDAHYAAIFHPHAPHENPAGHYGVIDGAGVDNTRPPGRAQIQGRRPNMPRMEQRPTAHKGRDEASGSNQSHIKIPERGRSKHSSKGEHRKAADKY